MFGERDGKAQCSAFLDSSARLARPDMRNFTGPGSADNAITTGGARQQALIAASDQ
jgi:hypothetical protein